MSKNLNGSFFTTKSLNGDNDVEINKLIASTGFIDDLSCNQLQIGTLNVIGKFGIIDNSINALENNTDFIDLSCANIDVSLNINTNNLTATGRKDFSSGLLNLGSTILNSNIVGNDKNIAGLNKLTSSTGNIIDFSCANLDVSLNSSFGNLSSTNFTSTNLTSTDLSINTLGFVKQMGINVVNGESYANGNNILKVAGHMNIDNFSADTGSSTQSAQLVIGNNSNNQFIKFRTLKTGTGIGASSIDFKNINADSTGVDYLNFKYDGSSTGAYLYKDGRFRASQLDIQVEDNTGTYLNFRDNVGDTASNDVGTFRSGIDSSEFPSAHFLDISFAGDYASNPSEIFWSTDKNKASYIDVSFVGISTKTPTEKLEVNGNIKGSDLFMTNGFVDTSFCIGSSPHKEFQFEVKGGSNFAVNTNDSDFVECGNLKSSSDTLELSSFGNIALICDANNNSDTKSIKFMTDGRLGTGTQLVKIEDGGAVKIGSTDSDSTGLLYLDGTTNKNGLIQVICSNSGKKRDGMSFKASSNNNTIIHFLNSSSTERGNIDGDGGSAVDFNTSSDRRLKTNIENMDSQLQNIMDLIPCKYNWIEDNEIGYGLIAQEVYSVYPHMRKKYEETYCANNPNYDPDSTWCIWLCYGPRHSSQPSVTRAL